MSDEPILPGTDIPPEEPWPFPPPSDAARDFATLLFAVDDAFHRLAPIEQWAWLDQLLEMGRITKARQLLRDMMRRAGSTGYGTDKGRIVVAMREDVAPADDGG